MTPAMMPDATDSSVGRASYERIGAQYGAIVDTKPYNAYYERPATLALLPPLAGAHLLEIGCGNGWYAEHFLAQGATVTAFDVSPTMVEQTRARVGDRARLLLADLAQPFTFAADGEFDVAVASLALHYVADWEPVLAEIHRVLRPDGVLVFSTHHPTSDLNHHPESHYFEIELITEEWRGLGTVQFYRRSLGAITRALAATGFVIEQMVEPLPTDEFRAVHPEGYARLLRFPGFLLVRARKTSPLVPPSRV